MGVSLEVEVISWCGPRTTIAATHPRALRTLVVDGARDQPAEADGATVVPLWRFLLGDET